MDLRDMIPRRWEGKHVPIRREDRSPLSALQSEINRVFDSVFNSDIESFGDRLLSFTPRMDIFESEKELTVTAELPGMEQKDVEIHFEGDQLTIRGEKRAEKEEKEKDYYRMERSYGSFSRSIRLPLDVDQDRASATFKNGVLRIILPKKEGGVSKKKIEIRSE